MIIENGLYVKFQYTLKDQTGATTFDCEEGETPWYIHGFNLILPGLEKALEGKSAGDDFTVEISPEDGFGERKNELIGEIMIDNLPEGTEAKKGNLLYTKDEEHGGIIPVLISHVGDKTCVLDANHPLAGITLVCDMKVLEVREPTEAERLEVDRALGGPEHSDGVMMEMGPDGIQTSPLDSGACSGCSCGDDDDDGGCSSCG